MKLPLPSKEPKMENPTYINQVGENLSRDRNRENRPFIKSKITEKEVIDFLVDSGAERSVVTVSDLNKINALKLKEKKLQITKFPRHYKDRFKSANGT